MSNTQVADAVWIRIDIASVSAQTERSDRSHTGGIDSSVERVMRASTIKQPSEAEFDRAREETFSNEGGAPKPDQDTQATRPGERNVAREEDHPDAVRAGVSFPARRSGYPNNRITFD